MAWKLWESAKTAFRPWRTLELSDFLPCFRIKAAVDQKAMGISEQDAEEKNLEAACWTRASQCLMLSHGRSRRKTMQWQLTRKNKVRNLLSCRNQIRVKSKRSEKLMVHAMQQSISATQRHQMSHAGKQEQKLCGGPCNTPDSSKGHDITCRFKCIAILIAFKL